MESVKKTMELEVKTGNTQKELEKVDKQVLKTSKNVKKAQKDWADYSSTLTKGNAQVAKSMQVVEKTPTANNKQDAALDALSKEQEAHENGYKAYEEIENKKVDLVETGAAKINAVVASQTQDSITLSATAVATAMTAMDGLNKVFAVAVPPKSLEEQAADRKSLLDGILADANTAYSRSEAVADEVFGKNPKKRGRKAEKLKNDIALREAQSAAYMGNLKLLDEKGLSDTPEYAETIANLGKVKTDAVNLGKGLNPDGSGGGVKGMLMRTFEMTPEEIQELKTQAVDLAAKIGGEMIDIQKKSSQRRLQNEKKTISAEHKLQSKQLEEKRDKGLISEKTYKREMEKLDAEKAKKEDEAERAAFEREKKISIAQAIMNTAVGIARLWISPGFPAAIPMTILLGAMGAVQIATIASQKYAQGGLIPLGDGAGVVKGRSHAQGGHQIYLDDKPIGEIEGGELLAIVNKHDTARIGALSAANGVHGHKFARGGLISPEGFRTSSVASPVGLDWMQMQQQVELAKMQDGRQESLVHAIRADSKEQVEAINKRIDTLKVVVLAQDVTDWQANIKKIEVKSSW